MLTILHSEPQVHPLGTVDDGLCVIGAAGDNFKMTIETIN